MAGDRFVRRVETALSDFARFRRSSRWLRPLPSSGPTILRDTVPVLLEGKTAPEGPSVRESTRFALDVASSAPEGSGWRCCWQLRALRSMIEFGLSRCVSRIVTLTDLRIERILCLAGWPRGSANSTHREHPRRGRISQRLQRDGGCQTPVSAGSAWPSPLLRPPGARRFACRGVQRGNAEALIGEPRVQAGR
ncbi:MULTISPECIES: acyl-homoserine-lactone synthase [unclassified Mesorhizobium]|uniref:acyl-homoserine-lactone synthase n=1 Tax=unclassified Mesorhizobium TaxID=325217 RepID=UPI003337FD33